MESSNPVVVTESIKLFDESLVDPQQMPSLKRFYDFLDKPQKRLRLPQPIKFMKNPYPTLIQHVYCETELIPSSNALIFLS